MLFLLFTGNHPLEGKNTCPPCMTPKLERKYFGENPVFIFDPIDDSNMPVPGLHKGAIGKWPILPGYLQVMWKQNYAFNTPGSVLGGGFTFL
ncbi:hypothetical protein FACS1894142_0630 [Spirochaetia bacterium]|nr:hypothetical protein FACS1894142_0630 [Spirochaetia bacterium]